MTPEEMKFWLDMFHSPVAIALAGGVAGSFITLVVTLLTLWHKSRQSKVEWERQEIRRKEERFFTLKNKAYRDFNKLFLIDRKTGQPLFATKWIGVSSALISYVSKPFRIEIMLLIGIALDLKKAEENGEKAEIPELERKFEKQIDAIHEKIHEDIISHHESVFNSQCLTQKRDNRCRLAIVALKSLLRRRFLRLTPSKHSPSRHAELVSASHTAQIKDPETSSG